MTDMIEDSNKTFNEAFVEWLFSTDGFRKSEPRNKLSHMLNRLEGIGRRKQTKLPRKLKKKLKKIQNVKLRSDD